MSAPGRYAFANVIARMRAARLLGSDAAVRLRLASSSGSRAIVIRDLMRKAGEGTSIATRAEALIADYAALAAGYPVGGKLFHAVAGLSEVENVKLLLRAVGQQVAPRRWRSLWRPMGALATVRLPPEGEEPRSARDLARIVERTPFAPLVESGLASASPRNTELSLDRFGSSRIVDGATDLPPHESAARELVLGLVRERDLESIRRAASFGVEPALASGVTALIGHEIGAAATSELASWTPDVGPLGPRLPRRLVGGAVAATDWDDLLRALRRRRRRSCASAFIGSPFRIAPGIAYVLLAEEELRALAALAEPTDAIAATGEDPWAIVSRALAASALGD